MLLQLLHESILDPSRIDTAGLEVYVSETQIDGSTEYSLNGETIPTP